MTDTAFAPTPPVGITATAARPSAAPAPLAPSDRLLWHHACEVAAGPVLLVPGLVEVCERAMAPGTTEHHAQRFACRIRPDARGRPTAHRLDVTGSKGQVPVDQFAVETGRLLDDLAAVLSPRALLHTAKEHHLHRLARKSSRRRHYVVLAGPHASTDLELDLRVWIDRDLGVAHRLLYHGRLRRPTGERLAATAVLGSVRCQITPAGHWHPVVECLRATFWSPDRSLPPRGTAERLTCYSHHWLASSG